MEIKTLAQILAESDNDSASTKPKPKTKKTAAPRDDAAVSAIASKSNTNPTLKPKTTSAAYKKNNAKKSTQKQRSSDTGQSKTDRTEDFVASTAFVSVSGHTHSESQSASPTSEKRKKRKKKWHPAAPYQPETHTSEPPKATLADDSIAKLLADARAAVDEGSDSVDNDTDNLPAALKAYLRSPEERQADIDAIKAESRLRWLAFYYLSRREYGRAELKQKLLDKEQDPEQVETLLVEFADKGYQSDYRTALMLIREGIRKGRGRTHIKRSFYQRKVDIPPNIDALIDEAQAASEAFSDIVREERDDNEPSVDWLRLAVEARIKKYGAAIPTTPKEKARQLRFLQYRGFQADICFQALNHDLQTLEERD